MAPQKKTTANDPRRRLVLLPCPLQGHINPMLQLAGLLHSKGFAITIAHTTYNAPDPSKYPEFSFAFIPAEVPSTSDIAKLIVTLNTNVQEPLRDQLEKMMAAEEEEEVPIGLIVDVLMYSATSAAETVGLPRIALRTGGAACFNVFFAIPMLCEKGFYPIEDCKREAPVIEAPPFKVSDLPNFEKDNWHELYKIIVQMIEGVRSSRAIVINTFEVLETSDLVKLRQDLQMPVFPVGPLHCFNSNIDGSLWAADRTCIEWLDQQKHPKSAVLYVSFGSLACVSRKELLEIAWGLAGSGQPFLWVLRHGSVDGGTTDLPQEFEEATRGRGKVVQWAPQKQVLRHPAVGGFWTHCGWNSILEGICGGVPMLCRPCFGDQMANSRMLTDVWKVGIPLRNEPERGEIGRVVRRLMLEDEGAEMRERILEMKVEADRCTTEHGMSQAYLEKLVDLLCLSI